MKIKKICIHVGQIKKSKEWFLSKTMKTNTDFIDLYVYMCEIVWLRFYALEHINFHELCNSKAIQVDHQEWNYITHRWNNKEVNNFPKDIYIYIYI